jgi:hypothetical protein
MLLSLCGARIALEPLQVVPAVCVVTWARAYPLAERHVPDPSLCGARIALEPSRRACSVCSHLGMRIPLGGAPCPLVPPVPRGA